MVSTHKLNRLFQRTDNARSNSAVQGGSPGVPNPPWVAPPAGQSADRLGYDGAGRMIAKRYIASYGSPSAIVGFTTTFDRASNKLYERALHAENRSHLYEPYDAVSNLPTGGYDSLDRVLQYQRGTLSSTGGDGGNGGGSIAVSGSTTQYIHLPGTDLQRSYALDSLGNWRNTVFTPSTTGTPTAQTEIRQHNLLNEITRTSNPAATPMTINATYDLNGNLTSVGTPAFTWDALNRLATASPGGEYYYDALNKRVSKTVSDVQTDFIYSGWRCVEDRNPAAEGGDGPIAQYVWGRYLDELLQITTLVSITTGMGDGTTTYSPGTYFPLQDLLYRTTAMVTISEDGVTIVEAYDFDAYGKTLIFNAADTGPNWWGPNAQQSPNSLCQFLFTGQRFDAETGLYYYKRRMYLAALGRFLSRDPIRHSLKMGNPYEYTGSRPSALVDSFGLQGCAPLPSLAPDPPNLPPEWTGEAPPLAELPHLIPDKPGPAKPPPQAPPPPKKDCKIWVCGYIIKESCRTILGQTVCGSHTLIVLELPEPSGQVGGWAFRGGPSGGDYDPNKRTSLAVDRGPWRGGPRARRFVDFGKPGLKCKDVTVQYPGGCAGLQKCMEDAHWKINQSNTTYNPTPTSLDPKGGANSNSAISWLSKLCGITTLKYPSAFDIGFAYGMGQDLPATLKAAK